MFVGLGLPDDWRAGLSELQRQQDRLAPGYFRWVQPALFHLTLVFLGSTPVQEVEAAAAAVERAVEGQQPFYLHAGRIGTFGQRRSPRVFWLGAHESDGALQRLRDNLERELLGGRVQFDPRPLVPHITLARARGRRSRPDDSTAAPRLLAQPPSLEPFRVSQVTLFEHQHGPGGLFYASRAVVALGRGSSLDPSC
jgi:2'-5' RNA ligase